MKILFIISAVIMLFNGCLTSGVPMGSFYTGDKSIYDNVKVSKVRKGMSKNQVNNILGPTKSKAKGLDKEHVNRYVDRYIGQTIKIKEGEYELWKYFATKNSTQMGLVGSSQITYRKSCIVVFSIEDKVTFFNCN